MENNKYYRHIVISTPAHEFILSARIAARLQGVNQGSRWFRKAHDTLPLPDGFHV
jgi:hypothetical protein